MKIKFSCSIFCMMILLGCSSNSSDDLTNPTNQLVKYSTDIAPVMNGNCTSCHSNPPVNGAPMHLTTLNDVKNAILNRGLIDRISKDQNDPNLMPSGGTRLPQSTIDKIKKWQTDGFLE